MSINNAERGQDVSSRSRMLFGEGLEQAEAARDHHVAVRDGEVGVKAGTSEFGALWASDGDEGVASDCVQGASRVVDTVAFAVEDLFVGKGLVEEALAEVLDLIASQLAGVVLLQRNDWCAQMEAEFVHVRG